MSLGVTYLRQLSTSCMRGNVCEKNKVFLTNYAEGGERNVEAREMEKYQPLKDNVVSLYLYLSNLILKSLVSFSLQG